MWQALLAYISEHYEPKTINGLLLSETGEMFSRHLDWALKNKVERVREPRQARAFAECLILYTSYIWNLYLGSRV